jgi:cytochrome c peroxidase
MPSINGALIFAAHPWHIETLSKESPMRTIACLLALAAVTPAVLAETPNDFLAAYAQEAKRKNPAYNSPSLERGQRFFTELHGREWSCASCHTRNPAATGKHAVTSKAIEPLAPSANAARFTRASKVEKWFKRNCNDVLGRVCTAQEKGDVLAYLMALK